MSPSAIPVLLWYLRPAGLAEVWNWAGLRPDPPGLPQPGLGFWGQEGNRSTPAPRDTAMMGPPPIRQGPHLWWPAEATGPALWGLAGEITLPDRPRLREDSWLDGARAVCRAGAWEQDLGGAWLGPRGVAGAEGRGWGWLAMKRGGGAGVKRGAGGWGPARLEGQAGEGRSKSAGLACGQAGQAGGEGSSVRRMSGVKDGSAAVHWASPQLGHQDLRPTGAGREWWRSTSS